MTSLKEVTNPIFTPAPAADEETWTRRARVMLMEPDAALRGVLTRTLLRAGCVVVFRRTLSQVVESLAEGQADCAVVALDSQPRLAVRLMESNLGHTLLIILSSVPIDPRLMRELPRVRFYEKPFDVRLLLEDVRRHAPAQSIPEEGRSS